MIFCFGMYYLFLVIFVTIFLDFDIYIIGSFLIWVGLGDLDSRYGGGDRYFIGMEIDGLLWSCFDFINWFKILLFEFYIVLEGLFLIL